MPVKSQEFNDLSHGRSSWTWSAACRKSSGVLAQNCTTNGLASQHQNMVSFQWISMHFTSFHVKMQGYASVFRCFDSDIVQVVIEQVWSGQNLDRKNVALTAHFFGRCCRRKVTYLIKLVKSLHLAVKLESPPTLGNQIPSILVLGVSSHDLNKEASQDCTVACLLWT